jgi:formylglycine-generating enzyme required for sulfatase activity
MAPAAARTAMRWSTVAVMDFATPPVGSILAKLLRRLRFGGNVWEWCLDLYKPGSCCDVLRCGSSPNSQRIETLISYRNVVDRNERDVDLWLPLRAGLRSGVTGSCARPSRRGS